MPYRMFIILCFLSIVSVTSLAADGTLDGPAFNSCQGLLTSPPAHAWVDTSSVDGSRLFAIADGLGVGVTLRPYHRAQSYGGPSGGLTRWIPADIQLLGQDGSEGEIPVLVSMARVGVFAEFLRAMDRLRIKFRHTEGKPIMHLMGTYIGLDASLMFLNGIYYARARNSHGVTISHLETGTDTDLIRSQGFIGAGIAVPIITIKPNFDKIPAGDPFWNSAVNW